MDYFVSIKHNTTDMSGLIIEPNLHDLREAREIFYELLKQPYPESKWQKFFTKYPYVLSRSLPLKLVPNEIIPLGRPGKSEPDFIFHHKESYTSWGVIELKRPDSNITTNPRKKILKFSDAVETAISQAEYYSEELVKRIYRPDEILFFGNPIYLFIIVGLSREMSKIDSAEFMRLLKRLPPNCTIIPYDKILKSFESTIPQQIILLKPAHVFSEITIDIPGLSPYVKQLEMVLIPAGEFLMGSPESEQGRSEYEGPQHRVTISQDFYLGKYPVTQAQWQAVMRNNPSHFKDKPNNPEEHVFWNDCREFNQKLKRMVKESFRLPTEAEWEYACRAGTTTRFFWGDDLRDTEIDEYAWYVRNSNNQTHEVGTKKPNTWGIFDMSGNVWEWCNDWYGEYSNGSQVDPTGSSSGLGRVLRGGSWSDSAGGGRSAQRGRGVPQNRNSNDGLRLARTK